MLTLFAGEAAEASRRGRHQRSFKSPLFPALRPETVAALATYLRLSVLSETCAFCKTKPIERWATTRRWKFFSWEKLAGIPAAFCQHRSFKARRSRPLRRRQWQYWQPTFDFRNAVRIVVL